MNTKSAYEQALKFMPPDRDFSDGGNAKLFSEFHKDKLCYAVGMGWMAWSGKHWERSKQKPRLAADLFTESMRKEASQAVLEAVHNCGKLEVAEPKDPEAIKKAKKALDSAREYFAHAASSRNGRRIGAIVSLAEPRLEKPVELFDKDWFFLNTQSGICDLRNGAMLPHNPNFHCSHITAVSPNNEGMEIWLEHLNRVTCGDMELAEGLQIKIGSALYGRVFSESLDFMDGDGGNGKSATFNAVFLALGDYATTFNVDVLTDNRGSEFLRTAAHLHGIRFVLGGELEKGRKLSTSVLKRLVSKDPVDAEFKYEDEFHYLPSHSVIVYTNNLPVVTAFDNGTWRRLNVWPFRAVIPSRIDIPNYENYLFEHCGSAILKWAIEGAVKFHQQGYKMNVPEAVRVETDRYRKSQIWVMPYLKSEYVDENPNGKATTRELYNHYQRWADENQQTTYSEKAFSQALQDAGYEHKKSHGTFYWRGIQPVARDETDKPMEML